MILKDLLNKLDDFTHVLIEDENRNHIAGGYLYNISNRKILRDYSYSVEQVRLINNCAYITVVKDVLPFSDVNPCLTCENADSDGNGIYCMMGLTYSEVNRFCSN